MNTKRWLHLISILVVLTMVLAACGGGAQEAAPAEEAAPTEEVAPTEAPAEEAEAPAEEAAPTEAPAEEAPAEEAAASGSNLIVVITPSHDNPFFGA
ncbi:MAG: hypothetical protein KDE58_16000, partial [Caldilineaceae bacterium]|nr:hypothetical protein [Caldilineaceae bacterium]